MERGRRAAQRQRASSSFRATHEGVAGLPHVGEKELFEKFRLDKPWDCKTNSSLIGSMPEIYQVPWQAESKSVTHYQTFFGKDAVFDLAGKFRPRQEKDVEQMVVGIVTPGVIWTKPDDVDADRPYGQWAFYHAFEKPGIRRPWFGGEMARPMYVPYSGSPKVLYPAELDVANIRAQVKGTDAEP